MKIAVVLLFVCSVVFSQSVINAIPAPVNASGLAWDGSHLWCGAYGVNGDTLYRIDPANGNIAKKLRWRQGADCYGLAFDGGNLWVSDHLTGTDSLFLVDTITGARVNAVGAYREYGSGIANDGMYLWHCVYYNPDGRVYHLQKNNGAVFDSIDIPNMPQPWGATWDSAFLWVCNDGNYGGAHRIYKVDVSLKQIVDSLDSPGTRPWGLAWDGNYLWVIARGTSPTGFVAYQIDLQGTGTPDIQVSPTSYDYGVLPFDSSAFFTLTIANVGSDTLVLDTICALNGVFTPPILDFPIAIPAGIDTGVAISFDPDTNAYYASYLMIVSNDPDEETTFIALSGRGVFPDPHLTPSSLNHDFGNVRSGYVADWWLYMVNEGYPLAVIDSMIFDDTRFFCSDQVLPCSLGCLDTISVQMLTTATNPGAYAGTCYLFSNDPLTPIAISLSALGDTTAFSAGDLIWSYDFTDNVVCVAGLADINNDARDDIAAESYGTGTSGGEHLITYWGNSSDHGVVQWGAGDPDFTGSWGDDCLAQGDDYDLDGVPDVILGTAWGDRSVYALRGTDGSIIWYYDSHSFDGEGGWVYSVKKMPDINNDNVGEVLAGIGGHDSGTAGPRSMYCFSGADGNTIWRFQAQDAVGSVNWIGDVNGDNVPDALCGAWGNNIDRRLYCVSGSSIGVITVPLWSYNCGGDIMSVISIPDVNGDSLPDVVCGTWSDSVFCLSGAAGTRLWATYVGGDVIKVCAVPDLFGSNTTGIAVAHIGNSFQVLRGSDGTVYWVYPIGSNSWTCDAIDDVNNDGVSDILTGNQGGVVYCFSGVDGSVIWSYNEGRLIYSIRTVSDITGDGYRDVAVGTQASGGVARLLVISGGSPQTGIALQAAGIRENFVVYPRISRSAFTIAGIRSTLSSVKIYNGVGQCVKVYKGAAAKSLVWRGDDDAGRVLAQGVYFITCENQGIEQAVKVILVR